MDRQNIFLIGPMGCGKTEVGIILAKRLERSFCDIDVRIATLTGNSVETIFKKEGEAGFRKYEAEVLRELSKQQDWVVATGGGVVMSEENRAILKQTGYVFYLKLDYATRLERLGDGRGRPLLAGNSYEEIADITQRLDRIRTPLYEEVSNHTVYNAGSLHNTVDEIARMVEA